MALKFCTLAIGNVAVLSVDSLSLTHSCHFLCNHHCRTKRLFSETSTFGTGTGVLQSPDRPNYTYNNFSTILLYRRQI